ncbi:MAG: MFS transporter [Desulfococcaceae bacterium]
MSLKNLEPLPEASAEAGSDPKNEALSDKWWTFLAVAVGVFMSTLDGSIVNIALPSIMADLAAPMAVVEWVMVIYLLVISSLLLSFGRLSDIRGRRWVYTRGLLVFSAGSLACGMAETAGWLVASRALQGLGAAMIMACTQAIVVETFPRQERGRALGMVGAVVASGLTLGPALGGWLIHHFSWSAIFYINVPIGLATAVAADRLLKGTSSDMPRREPFDFFGAALLAASVAAIVFVITHGREWGWTHPAVLGLTALWLVTGLGLFGQEVGCEHPILSPALLRVRLFSLPILSLLVIFGALFSVVFLMPFYLIHPVGLPVKTAGMIMVTPFVFLFLVAPVSGAISDRIGSRLLCTLGMVCMAASLFTLARLTADAPLLAVLWRLALAGIGTAVFMAPNNAAAMSAVPVRHMGVAAGTVAMVRNLGMVLGIALAASVFNAVFANLTGGMDLKVYRPELQPAFMTAFGAAMTAGGVLAGFGVLITYFRGPEKR